MFVRPGRADSEEEGFTELLLSWPVKQTHTFLIQCCLVGNVYHAPIDF